MRNFHPAMLVPSPTRAAVEFKFHGNEVAIPIGPFMLPALLFPGEGEIRFVTSSATQYAPQRIILTRLSGFDRTRIWLHAKAVTVLIFPLFNIFLFQVSFFLEQSNLLRANLDLLNIYEKRRLVNKVSTKTGSYPKQRFGVNNDINYF